MEPALSLQKPSKTTLKKYGLTEADWQEIADRQGGVCAVCKKLTSTGRLCIDHEHVKKWKQMPPEQRKTFVRGLLCWVCNHFYLARGITVERSKNVTKYLEDYADRKATP